MMHVTEEIEVVLVGIVDHFLASLDVLELDTMFDVYPPQLRCRYFDFWKCPVEHPGPLYQRELSPFLEGILADDVIHVMPRELCS